MISPRPARAAAALLCTCTAVACAPPPPSLPDWSGQWENVGATPSPDGGFYEPLERVLKDLQWSPPLTPESRAVIDRVVAGQRAAMQAMREGKDPGGAVTACTFGYPTVMLESPLMFEILTTPNETALIFSSREIRHVYTDGREHPGRDDLWATPWGDSIGRWEGQTLVIDTIAVKSAFPGREGSAVIAFGMAVLAACETGAGQPSGGEGLLGLAWAFRAAGCPSIVASSWKVDERATALLMIRCGGWSSLVMVQVLVSPGAIVPVQSVENVAS